MRKYPRKKTRRMGPGCARAPSLRGTIPEGIVEALKLNHGDEINWSIEIKNNKIIATVEKIKE